MAKLVITADIHGLYSGWQKVLTFVEPEDSLAIAGDLFGTRFPKPEDPDYLPEKIRDEYIAFKNPKQLVYGNCDIREFFPGLKNELHFTFNNKRVLLLHGDVEYPDQDFDIMIFGHTHVPFLHQENGKINLNPGSPCRPRGFIGKSLLATIALWDTNTIQIINIKNGKTYQKIEIS